MTGTPLPKDFLGRGWRFPPALDPGTGRIALVEHEEDIKQSLRIIACTSPGERLMRPDFGCGAHDLPFSSTDASTIGRVRDAVREALLKYEPRIDLVAVDVTVPDGVVGALKVEVKYLVRTTNRSGNVTFPFYLPGNS